MSSSQTDASSDASDTEPDYRTSGELRRYDAETLTAEEEAERTLLSQEKAPIAEEDGSRHRASSKQSRRKVQKEKWRGGRQGEADQLILEEGATSSAESSVNSSAVDLRLEDRGAQDETSIPTRMRKLTTILIIFFILLAFFAFAYGAFRASSPPVRAQALSNGTHEFAPTTILISLDGFRADFLHRGITPHLKNMMEKGTSPRYMLPSFPSLTFPNHFTLATGHYPESHGIVGNNFYDPVLQKQFTYADKELSMKPEYWNAEPLWVTAELQDVRTAIHMWPGSEAHIGTVEPTYVDKYNGSEELENKVNRILRWLDLPGPNDAGAKETSPRPQLIAAYVPDVDHDGHAFGPNSTAIRSTITNVDSMLGSLFNGLEQRNLTGVVNIVVVSDHGMATTSNKRVLQLEDLVDTALIEHTDGWPLFGLRPYNTSQAKLDEIYQGIAAKSKEAAYVGKFDVYLRDHDMPERYHFSKSERIAPLWIVPKAGYAIAPKHEYDLSVALNRGDAYVPAGLHGYDHEHPLMRAIFLARGPAFPHPKGSSVAPFQNTEVYNIVCDSLGIEPAPNNGTLRLPLKTTGVHDAETLDIPDDLPPADHIDANTPLPPTASQPAEPESSPEQFNSEAPAQGEVEHEAGDETTSWRQWINEKLEKIKGWATDLFGAHKKVKEQSA